MRILIVAMSNSVHTARWISQIADQGWDIHLFPSIDVDYINSDLKNVTVHHTFFSRHCSSHSSVSGRGIPVVLRPFAVIGRSLMERLFPDYRIRQLQKLIQHIKPDIIHTMETQAAGYLTAAVKEKLPGEFPPWLHTIWGNDIYLFGRLAAHKERIRNVLENCDYLVCEGQRDVDLAREFGFSGSGLLVTQATGGFDILRCANLRSQEPTSSRRNIMLKGYQSWAGRALVGLRALERCADLLSGYTVMIYSANPDVAIAAELFTVKTGVPTVILPKTPHEEMLRLQGKARLSISLAISDGVPNSFLEAIVMGSFPIQSWTACADEWVEDGSTGLLVPPEDPDVVELAIRRALADNELVDNAAAENWRTAQARLDYHLLKQQAIELYSTVAG